MMIIFTLMMLVIGAMATYGLIQTIPMMAPYAIAIAVFFFIAGYILSDVLAKNNESDEDDDTDAV